jgi:TfoX/Sxy family transcriptional regulator of competence genes
MKVTKWYSSDRELNDLLYRPLKGEDMDANKIEANRFDSVTEAFRNHADVLPARMFGSNGLKVKGKVFAMMVRGSLVVKLPKERVDKLVGDELGKYFDPGHGRLMKQWVSLPDSSIIDWLALSEEARSFVSSS